jgi:hypothetical protein
MDQIAYVLANATVRVDCATVSSSPVEHVIVAVIVVKN